MRFFPKSDYEEVVIGIEDNGIGIPPEYGEKVFQIFQRLHNKSDYPGSGLGLSICKKIVGQHDGAIWFTSNPSGGTTFFFSLQKQNVPGAAPNPKNPVAR